MSVQVVDSADSSAFSERNRQSRSRVGLTTIVDLRINETLQAEPHCPQAR